MCQDALAVFLNGIPKRFCSELSVRHSRLPRLGIAKEYMVGIAFQPGTPSLESTLVRPELCRVRIAGPFERGWVLPTICRARTYW